MAKKTYSINFYPKEKRKLLGHDIIQDYLYIVDMSIKPFVVIKFYFNLN